MNYSEQIAHNDSGMFDGAYRIYNGIKERKESGTVGRTLMNLTKERFETLKSLEKSLNDFELQNKVHRWIREIENWYSYAE